jgi:uncharacterized MAPEG superfamily protein
MRQRQVFRESSSIRLRRASRLVHPYVVTIAAKKLDGRNTSQHPRQRRVSVDARARRRSRSSITAAPAPLAIMNA